jgi:hypothetical protein
VVCVWHAVCPVCSMCVVCTMYACGCVRWVVCVEHLPSLSISICCCRSGGGTLDPSKVRAYGSISQPSLPGSAGGGSYNSGGTGGGIVYLDVSGGQLTVNGTIQANGGPCSSAQCGGGSGIALSPFYMNKEMRWQGTCSGHSTEEMRRQREDFLPFYSFYLFSLYKRLLNIFLINCA